MSVPSVFEIYEKCGCNLTALKNTPQLADIPKSYYRCSLKSFFSETFVKYSLNNRLLELLCIRFCNLLISKNFEGSEWDSILSNFNNVPTYGSIYTSEKETLFEEFEKSYKHAHWNQYNHRYTSDTYPKYDYIEAAPIYYALAKNFDYRHSFSKEKALQAIREAQDGLKYCHYASYYSNAHPSEKYYIGDSSITFVRQKKMFLDLIGIEAELKMKHEAKLIADYIYCKDMILLWKNFIEKYEDSLVYLLTENDPDLVKYVLTTLTNSHYDISNYDISKGVNDVSPFWKFACEDFGYSSDDYEFTNEPQMHACVAKLFSEDPQKEVWSLYSIKSLIDDDLCIQSDNTQCHISLSHFNFRKRIFFIKKK